ncbi:Histidyl-tRNA synthetase [Patulibacter medicamentivorans]|uniref:Histidine--tRNA ligase n=1 Tax=Patulibacter medicamentivorans TaxID=1097667 RepID=H0EBB3_9ACTN|nr:histidine--tRNA ligase [Patulibacter medicamentivorans]EHN08989.1 Histidyl-tRNA synthetase [Patulibacter medicamentivorans]
MAEIIRAQRGTHDVLPDEGSRRQLIELACREILGNAGYQRIETPIFEATELFHRGVGGSTDIVQKETYTFDDRGGRSLTLRPEGTAGVARAYLEHGMHKLPQPVRVWYWGPFFRYERAQAGRQRQFWQFGAEALGSDDPALDAEGIVLLQRIIERVLRSGATQRALAERRAAGATGVDQDAVAVAADAAVAAAGLRLRIGSLGSIAGRAAYRELLVAYLREHQDRLSAEVVERIDLNPLRAFDADDPGTREVMAGAPLLLDHLPAEDAEHFAEVRALLDAAGVAYEIDPTLVRGLDYYSRTLFEFTSDALGAQSGVGGGGRYDGLVEQLGGPATPAFGWGAGIERLLLCLGEMPSHARRPVAYVIWPEGRRREAFAVADAVRTMGYATELDLAGRGLKGQRRRAERSGAQNLISVQDDGTLAVRRIADGREEAVADAAAAADLVGRWQWPEDQAPAQGAGQQTGSA